ncbi:hypothetical protein SAMN05421824_1763 [Hyunsoonleella jejuensis]|uniref:Uncharacterized protein n=1 Tax=Hyunsoonleella jejuensis TaxID=419940 RepID=A0A1H9GDG7_9FLAO|nr:DUF6638 family protein [Hyunsoonleella jejuensis]SEQ48126.1 hypothetical protein SAMN05421824_1763 [Hyunsoonleella jejuensis]
MNKLKQANLYRSELIPVSGKLVERYNKCLVKLGFSETKLNTFHIDGIGWSPEVAEEKDDTSYLNNGDANPHGIIISPLQKGKPVYLPFHTFDRDLMKYVFKVHGVKIKDITRDSAICLDFDQNIDAFYEPLDVLKYDEITVKFHLIDNLDKVKAAQLELVDEFNRGNNFISETMHQKLLDSAKTYGDLRNRDLDLHELEYTTDSFYTRAFGGVYVLRDFIVPIVVFEDETWHKEAIKDTTHDVLIYHINQPELMDKLRSHSIIDCDLEAEVRTERYNRIKKFEMFQFLKQTQHPIKDILDDPILFKSYLNKLDINSLKKIMSVERYLEKIEKSNQFKIVDIIDDKLFFALHKPHSSLEAKHQDLIWKLLMNIAPKDVLFWYWYDKEDFYKNFKNWDDSFKDWAIETIRNNI